MSATQENKPDAKPPASNVARGDASSREAITFYNPHEEREAEKAPLQWPMIKRIFRYTNPHAAKRNWLFLITFTRGAQLPALAWLIGFTINGPIARGNLTEIYWVRSGILRAGTVHHRELSLSPAVRARNRRGGGA